MSMSKILPADLAGKGVIGLPDLPLLDTLAMQKRFDELVTDVVVPKYNATVDTLSSVGGAAAIGAVGGTVAGHIASTANPHQVTAAQVNAYTKAQTDTKINERITEIGSADMTKAVYDKNSDGVVDNSERLAGQLPAYYAAQTAVDAAMNATKFKLLASSLSWASGSITIVGIGACMEIILRASSGAELYAARSSASRSFFATGVITNYDTEQDLYTTSFTTSGDIATMTRSIRLIHIANTGHSAAYNTIVTAIWGR